MAEWCSGKSVFITGASAGIGAALAREFARQGAKVALAARRADRLEGVQRTIKEAGGESLAVVCDVTDPASIKSAVEQTVQAFGCLDIVIANAGYGISGFLKELTTDDYRRQFNTNVFGVLDTIYAALPHLEASKGQLVLIASVMGRVGMPTGSAYNASKFAVCGLAEAIYYELGARGVAVTCIEPGLVESEFRSVDNEGVFHSDRPDAAPKWLCMPTDTAARHIMRAIRRKQFEAVITLHGKLAVFFNRHFPRTFRAIYRLLLRGRLDKAYALRGRPQRP